MDPPALGALALKSALQNSHFLPGPFAALRGITGGSVNELALKLCRVSNGTEWVQHLEPLQSIRDHIDFIKLAREAVKYGNVQMFEYAINHPYHYSCSTRRYHHMEPLGEAPPLARCKIVQAAIKFAATRTCFLDYFYKDDTIASVIEALFRGDYPNEARTLVKQLLQTRIYGYISFDFYPQIIQHVAKRDDKEAGIILFEYALVTEQVRSFLINLIEHDFVSMVEWSISRTNLLEALNVSFCRSVEMAQACKVDLTLEALLNISGALAEYILNNIHYTPAQLNKILLVKHCDLTAVLIFLNKGANDYEAIVQQMGDPQPITDEFVELAYRVLPHVSNQTIADLVGNLWGSPSHTLVILQAVPHSARQVGQKIIKLSAVSYETIQVLERYLTQQEMETLFKSIDFRFRQLQKWHIQWIALHCPDKLQTQHFEGGIQIIANCLTGAQFAKHFKRLNIDPSTVWIQNITADSARLAKYLADLGFLDDNLRELLVSPMAQHAIPYLSDAARVQLTVMATKRCDYSNVFGWAAPTISHEDLKKIILNLPSSIICCYNCRLQSLIRINV